MLSWLLTSTFLLSSAALCGASSAVPTFEVNDLLSGRRADELSLILETTGLLAVRMPNGFSKDRESALLRGMCGSECHDDFLTVTNETPLNDPSTLRNTLATATVGEVPLPLPQELEQVCGAHVAQAMDALRDHVSTATNAFVHALDRLLNLSPDDVLMKNAYGNRYQSVSKITASATHLEHFHIYSKKEHSNQEDVDAWSNKDKSLFWHTDAGLFLAFVPAVDCQDPQGADQSFWMDSPSKDGAPNALEFPTDSVIIMLGAGAEHWLNTPVPLKATRHAVRMEPGQKRAWYGMMTLVPDEAIVQEQPQQRTFKEMQNAMATLGDRPAKVTSGDGSHVSIGCGAVPEYLGLDQDAASPRRRLQHVNNPNDCNNQTNFFCWMSCLDIPDSENLDDYLDSGFSLYCMDPAVYAQGHSVADAVEPCPFGVHNANCKGEWIATDPHVPGYHFHQHHESNSTPGHHNSSTPGHHNTSTPDDQQDDNTPGHHQQETPDGDFEDKWCYGGTSMYMDGFHWTHSTCVIYLFPEWVLSTRGKLVAASFGTVVFGALLEFVIFHRRRTISAFSPGYKRLAASSLFYGTQLTMGYMIMLIIMTYSGALFLSTVLGLVGGHIFFNSKDALFGKKDAETKALASTERTQHGVPSDETRFMTDSSYQAGDTIMVDQESGVTSQLSDNNDCTDKPLRRCPCVPEEGEDAEVPEGITPCCQNDLE